MDTLWQRGFSLLELLVTLLVVVIITSVISLNVALDGSDLELESNLQTIANVSGYALDEAQMRGVDYGLLLEVEQGRDGPRYRYSWREHRPEGWRPPEQDADLFAGSLFPAGVELALELDEMPLVELAQGGDPGREIQDQAPQVFFYASGEVTSGNLVVRDAASGEMLWRLVWDLLGRFELLRRGVDEEE